MECPTQYKTEDNVWVSPMYYKGDLRIHDTGITSLGLLQHVVGALVAGDVKSLVDLGDLVKVDRNLHLVGTSIRTLGKVCTVDGYVDCAEVRTLVDLGALEIVLGYLDITGTSVTSLGSLKKLGGSLYIYGLRGLKAITGLESVAILSAANTGLRTLGSLQQASRIDLTGSDELSDLGDLEEVETNINLTGTNVRSLGKLKEFETITLDPGSTYTQKEFEAVVGRLRNVPTDKIQNYLYADEYSHPLFQEILLTKQEA